MWWMCVCTSASVHTTRHIIMIIPDCGSARRFIPFVAHMWMRCNFFCWFDRISEAHAIRARLHNHFYCGNERWTLSHFYDYLFREPFIGHFVVFFHPSYSAVDVSGCVCVAMPDSDKLLVYLKNSFCVACTWLDTWSISISLWANRFVSFN